MRTKCTIRTHFIPHLNAKYVFEDVNDKCKNKARPHWNHENYVCAFRSAFNTICELSSQENSKLICIFSSLDLCPYMMQSNSLASYEFNVKRSSNNLSQLRKMHQMTSDECKKQASKFHTFQCCETNSNEYYKCTGKLLISIDNNQSAHIYHNNNC